MALALEERFWPLNGGIVGSVLDHVQRPAIAGARGFGHLQPNVVTRSGITRIHTAPNLPGRAAERAGGVTALKQGGGHASHLQGVGR